MSFPLTKWIDRALATDQAIRVGSWGIGKAKEAAATLAARNPEKVIAVVKVTSFLACVRAGSHDFGVNDDLAMKGDVVCTRCGAVAGSTNLLDLIAEAREDLRRKA